MYFRSKEHRQARLTLKMNALVQGHSLLQFIMINPFDLVENVEHVSLLDLPIQVQSVIKRMSKKDLNTRIKGLSELCEFIRSSDKADFDHLQNIFVTLNQFYHLSCFFSQEFLMQAQSNQKGA